MPSMLTLFPEPPGAEGRLWRALPMDLWPLGYSAGLHVVALTLLFTVRFDAGPASEIAESLDLPPDHEVLWLPTSEELPPIAPPKNVTQDKGPKRSRNRAPQTIVADDPSPDSDRQKIWSDVPDIKIDQDVPAPNLVSWGDNSPRLRFELERQEQQAPGRQPLAKAKPPGLTTLDPSLPDFLASQPKNQRYFVQREDLAAPGSEALPPEKAPDLAVVAPVAAGQLAPDKLVPMRFRMERQAQAAPERQGLAAQAAPDVATGPVGAIDIELPRGLRPLRYHFEAGRPAAPGRTAVAAGGGPGLEGVGGSETGTAAGNVLAMLGARGPRGAPAPPPVEFEGEKEGEGTGGPGGESGEGGPKLVVAGLDPASKLPGSIPAGRRRGRFSATPDGGPGGAEMIGGTAGGGLPVPGLSVARGSNDSRRAVSSLGAIAGANRGATEGTEPTPLPKDRIGLLDDLGKLEPTDNRGAAAKEVPLGPDDELDPEDVLGRKAIYTMAVNMPNINSSSGSWMVQFSELDKGKEEAATQDSAPKEKLAAPAPRVKVDPKYVRTAETERIEGDVVLYGVVYEDGTVDRIRVVKSLDGRLDISAVSALSKWRFYPAMRGSEPVRVEILVSIPFRLRVLEEREPRNLRKVF